MPNIFLTSKCNLNCPYCFASEFVNKEFSEISFDNFLKIVDFIKKGGQTRIGLIGGEPTLYPLLSKVLEFLNKDEHFKLVTLYSNGLEIDKFVDYITNDKFELLVNVNSPQNLGSRYEKLSKNIELLKSKNINFVLGINIYEENMDYSYIFNLLKIAERSQLRFSMSVSNDIKEDSKNILDDFKKIKPTIMSFLKDCLTNDIVPYYDCCSVPDCVLTDDDRRLMAALAKKANESELAFNPVNTCLTCMPVLDIFPDMTVGRCFGLAKYYRVPLSNFKSLNMIYEYFFNSVDVYSRLAYVDEKCENCRFRLYNKCGICFAYKLKKIDKLKKLCLENI